MAISSDAPGSDEEVLHRARAEGIPARRWPSFPRDWTLAPRWGIHRGDRRGHCRGRRSAAMRRCRRRLRANRPGSSHSFTDQLLEPYGSHPSPDVDRSCSGATNRPQSASALRGGPSILGRQRERTEGSSRSGSSCAGHDEWLGYQRPRPSGRSARPKATATFNVAPHYGGRAGVSVDPD